MSKPIKRFKPRKARIRKRVLIVGLVAFLLLDIVLVAFAASPRVPETTPAAPETPKATVSPHDEPAPAETPIPAPALATIAPARIIAVRDERLAWRAATGPCGTAARPEMTTDSGVTWQASDASVATGVVSLQSIQIEGDRVASMVGLRPSDCTSMLVRTFVGGDDYEEYPADLDQNWYVDPLDRSSLHAPDGNRTAPCEDVVVLAARSELEAAALCSDSLVYTTSDGGAVWSGAGAAPGAMTVVAVADGYLLAIVGDPTCSGVTVMSLTGPISGGPVQAPVVACVLNALPPQALAGNVALGAGAGVAWLWAGETIARSSDGGATWG
jgi:hypothetical protein